MYGCNCLKSTYCILVVLHREPNLTAFKACRKQLQFFFCVRNLRDGRIFFCAEQKKHMFCRTGCKLIPTSVFPQHRTSVCCTLSSTRAHPPSSCETWSCGRRQSLSSSSCRLLVIQSMHQWRLQSTISFYQSINQSNAIMSARLNYYYFRILHTIGTVKRLERERVRERGISVRPILRIQQQQTTITMV